jgi:phosphodiesterase/alkaline phosphatase D-like protein
MVLAGLSAALVALSFPAISSAKTFSLGVTAGEITASSAKVWAHAEKKGKFYAEVAEDKRFKDVVKAKKVKAKPGDDFTLQKTIKGLDSGEDFYYHFCTSKTPQKSGKARAATASAKGKQKCSKRGHFETAPASSQSATIRFAFTGDTDATPSPGASTPFFNNFEVFAQMINEKNDFNIHFGDTIYSDSEVGGVAPALTLQQKWAKYKLNLGVKNLQDIRKSTGFYSHWDDHEFINDFSIPEDGQALYDAGVSAFTDYAPVNYQPATGLYRSFRWGANMEMFFLDERSFRSAKASAGGTCDNPDTGAPDLAPTAPDAQRAVFSALIPSLAQPVSQQCLDTINDPNRTLLGKAQLDRFVDEVSASTAKFKIIINETPIQQFFGLPYDRWEGYAHERVELLNRLQNAGVKNLIFLTTDTHANFINVVRLRTFAGEKAPANAPAGPQDTPYSDYVSGPVATNTFWKEIDSVTGQAGAGKLLSQAFFNPQPPTGVGMACSQGDVFSYAEVEVSSASVTIHPKDAQGNTVVNTDGTTPCGPYTIPAQ